MSHPKSLFIRHNPLQDPTDISLVIAGQGVILFTATSSMCSYRVCNADHTDGLNVTWTETGVSVIRSSTGEAYQDPTNSKGLLPTNANAFYWFSIDAQNQQLYAGVGESRRETSVYTYTFSDEDRKAKKAFLESLVTIGAFIHVNPFKMLRDPITNSLPHRVSATLSLDALAKGLYMPKSHLSTASQQMHDCIKDTVLDTDDFPEFSQAIKQSIEDGWCKKRLIEKSGEFDKENPNLDETYLRITLGRNNGESPGIPYVLEIWPAGHYSPIHSHAGAEAIIKVLHGTICVRLFPFLSQEVDPFTVAEFSKDDVMWISPTLNQIHQLQNRGAEEPCMTIQCYMYDQENHRHYDYFDYLDSTGQVKQYEPDSDMDFVAFKALMKQEWENRQPNGMFSCFL